METDDDMMRLAIAQARLSAKDGGIPIGSVMSRQGKVIARGHNQRVQLMNPVLHAEIDCLQHAGRCGSYADVTLYSTLMPCYMCAGAVVQFHIKRVVVGESRTFAGAREFMESHGVTISDLDLDECFAMMREFIAQDPGLWYEDIGEPIRS